MIDRLPRLLVLDRRTGDDAHREGHDLAASVALVSRLDVLADGIAPRGEEAIVVAATIRDGGMVLGAWSDTSPSAVARRRTGGPVLQVPPGALHLALWSPDLDTWLPTPSDRVANRNARAFARALRANTGGRELLVRDGGVVGCFGWAWGPARGLTLEAFVASETPLAFVDTGADPSTAGSPQRRLAAGFPMRPYRADDLTGGDVVARLVRELAPRVREVVALSDAALDLDLSRTDESNTPPCLRGRQFAAPPSPVPMGWSTCRVTGGADGLTQVCLTGEIFRPDDLDTRWTSALRGRWPAPDDVAATLARVEGEAAARSEGAPPLEELAASLSVAISLARDHAR